MAEAKAKRVKRSKDEIFLDKGETLAKAIGAKYDDLRALAARGGYDQAKVTALFAYIDKKGDAAAEAFKAGLSGVAVQTGDDFSLLKAAEAVAAETPAT